MGLVLAACGSMAPVIGTLARVRGRSGGARATHPRRRPDPDRDRGDPPAHRSAPGPALRPPARPVRRLAGDLDVRPVPDRHGRSGAGGWPRRRRRRATPSQERYEAVIGIEVHCQLGRRARCSARCSTAYDGAPPNSHTCPVCLGPAGSPADDQPAGRRARPGDRRRDRGDHPAATRWDRKNYFYPDLPKGYQISQYDLPLRPTAGWRSRHRPGPFEVRIHPGPPRGGHGQADPLDRPRRPAGQPRRLQPLRRAADGDRDRARRCGPPSRPAAMPRSSSSLLRTIGVSDADMERGQLRVEANVSLRPRGTEPFGTRVEVKNMNSFRSVERAIEFEIERQAAALDAGEIADPGHPRLGRRPRADLRHAVEGGLPRLPLLPGARPAAAPGRPGLARRAPGRACPSCRPPGESATSRPSACPPTTRRDRRRPGPCSPLRGDPGRGPDLAAQGDRQPGHRRLRPGRQGDAPSGPPRAWSDGPTRPSWPISSGRIARGELSRTNAREVFDEHVSSGASVASIVAARGFHQISDSAALGRRSTRSLQPTRRPWPTITRASRPWDSSSGR